MLPYNADKNVNQNSIELFISKRLQKLNMNCFSIFLVAKSLYLSAEADCDLIYPEIESGFIFTKRVNHDSMISFNFQIFTVGSCILTESITIEKI